MKHLRKFNRDLLDINRSGMVLCTLLAILFIAPLPGLAKVEIVQFDDPAKQALYQDMIQELRCLVCQNQNLADSNAELAVDLRRKTRELIEQGKTRQDVVAFMVDRYGEFVLYRPAFNKSNLVLWLSPVVLLIIALWIVLRARNRGKNDVKEFSESERIQVRAMLNQSDVQETQKGIYTSASRHTESSDHGES